MPVSTGVHEVVLANPLYRIEETRRIEIEPGKSKVLPIKFSIQPPAE
jgi:hypothetical protein